MEQTINQLTNPYLLSDIQNGTLNESEMLLYSIEKSSDKHNIFWELSISHDLLEGFNGQDIQELGSYHYATQADAEADIQLMIDQTKLYLVKM